MSRLVLLSLIGSSLLICAEAQAADMKGGYAGTGLAPQMVEYGSLWYIRGDVSFASNPGPSVLCNCVLQDSLGQDNGAVVSAGMGYQLTRFFRLEGTVEHRFKTEITFKSPDGSTGTTDLKSYLGMVNAYVDIPLMKNVTPYVGAGAGLAYNQLGTLNKINVPCSSCEPTSWEGSNTISTAWALMAGVGYDLNANTKLDVGYRFLSLGSPKSSNVTNLGVSPYKYEYKDVTSHDLHVGLRYMLD